MLANKLQAAAPSVVVAGDAYAMITGFYKDATVFGSYLPSAIASNGTVLCVLSEVAAKAATSTDGVTWTTNIGPRNAGWPPSTTNNQPTRMAHGAGRFVASGWNNVGASTDGVTWTSQGTGGRLMMAVAFDDFSVDPDGLFIAVGNTGSLGTYRKIAGTWTWTFTSSAFGATWGTGTAHSVASLGGVFCAAGQAGRCATSVDGGANWTYQSALATALSSQDGLSMVSTGSSFVVGAAGGRIATSTDGATWTAVSTLRATGWGTTGSVRALAYNGSRLCAVGDTGKVAYSDDQGANWTFVSIGSTVNFNEVAWHIDKFVATGASGQVWTSPDATSWTSQDGLSKNLTEWGTKYCAAALWDGSTYFAWSASWDAAGSSALMKSTDGITWNFEVVSYGGSIACVAKSASTYVAAVDANLGKVLTSSDGATWTGNTNLAATAWGANAVRHIAWNGSVFVALGLSGRCATSTDGVNWTYQSGFQSVWGTGVAARIRVIGGVFYVCSASTAGRLASSSDGVTWTLVSGLSSVFTFTTNDIASNGSRMVVVGASGRSAYSDDGGVTWSSSSATSPTQATGSTLVIDQLVWTGAQFVAIQAGAFAATSVSGTSWVNRTTSLRDSGWVSPTYGGGTAQVGTYAAVLANDKYLFFGPEGQAVISPF